MIVSYMIMLLILLCIPQFVTAQDGLMSDVQDNMEDTTNAVTGQKDIERESTPSSNQFVEQNKYIEDIHTESKSTINEKEHTEVDVAKETADKVETVTDTVEKSSEVIGETLTGIHKQMEKEPDLVSEPPLKVVKKKVDQVTNLLPITKDLVAEPNVGKSKLQELIQSESPIEVAKRSVETDDMKEESRYILEEKHTNGNSQSPIKPISIPDKEAVIPNQSSGLQNHDSQKNVKNSIQVYAYTDTSSEVTPNLINILYGKASLFFTQWMNAPPSEPPQIFSFLKNKEIPL